MKRQHWRHRHSGGGGGRNWGILIGGRWAYPGAAAVDYGLAVLGHQSSSLELKLALNGDVISTVRDPPFAIPLNGVVATMMMIIIIIIFLRVHTWPIFLLFSVFVHFAAMVILGVHTWPMENDLCKIIRIKRIRVFNSVKWFWIKLMISQYSTNFKCLLIVIMIVFIFTIIMIIIKWEKIYFMIIGLMQGEKSN